MPDKHRYFARVKSLTATSAVFEIIGGYAPKQKPAVSNPGEATGGLLFETTNPYLLGRLQNWSGLHKRLVALVVKDGTVVQMMLPD